MKGHGKGIFTWLVKAPWKDPGFSSVVLSALIFGFMGGITGVTIGTEQINIIAHNTLRIPGHFHVTVVGGTTLAFMGLTYYVVPAHFPEGVLYQKLASHSAVRFWRGYRDYVSRACPFAGSYGVPRRHWDVEFAGAGTACGI